MWVAASEWLRTVDLTHLDHACELWVRSHMGASPRQHVVDLLHDRAQRSEVHIIVEDVFCI